MKVWTIFLYVLLVAMLTDVTKTGARAHVNGEWSVAADCLIGRLKRSGSGIRCQGVLASLDAIQSLIRGATQVKTSKPYRLFEKVGNYQQAIKDFISVVPQTDMKTFPQPGGPYGAVGRVGDSQITVRSRKTDGKPTVEIRIHRDDKEHGKLSYKINYVDE